MSSPHQLLAGQGIPTLCSRCKKLERQRQLVLDKIHSVVAHRFESMSDKLHELFQLQDRRDQIGRALQAHRHLHVAEVHKRKGSCATTSDPKSDRLGMAL